MRDDRAVQAAVGWDASPRFRRSFPQPAAQPSRLRTNNAELMSRSCSLLHSSPLFSSPSDVASSFSTVSSTRYSLPDRSRLSSSLRWHCTALHSAAASTLYCTVLYSIGSEVKWPGAKTKTLGHRRSGARRLDVTRRSLAFAAPRTLIEQLLCAAAASAAASSFAFAETAGSEAMPEPTAAARLSLS